MPVSAADDSFSTSPPPTFLTFLKAHPSNWFGSKTFATAEIFSRRRNKQRSRELDASIAEADAGQTSDVAEALAELRAKPQEFPQFRVTTEAARPFDVASTLDDVRQRLAQAAAFAHAKLDLFNQGTPTEDDEARRRRESLAHLIQATAEAIDDALEAGDQRAAELVTRPAGIRTT